MNIALIVAGGKGARAGQDVPKQFLTVYDTPIIVYTMENIKATGLFNELYVVCAKEWESFVCSYAKQYGIDVFSGTIEAGETRFDSMVQGVEFLKSNHSEKDVLCITDGNRPLIPARVFKECIDKIQRTDCCVAAEPCYDSLFTVNMETHQLIKHVDRSLIFKEQCPEVAELDLVYEICEKAKQENNTNKPLAGLMIDYGKKVSFVEGSSKNFKITTADDFAVFKALIGERRLQNLK